MYSSPAWSVTPQWLKHNQGYAMEIHSLHRGRLIDHLQSVVRSLPASLRSNR